MINYKWDNFIEFLQEVVHCNLWKGFFPKKLCIA